MLKKFYSKVSARLNADEHLGKEALLLFTGHLLERGTENPRVGGSIPPLAALHETTEYLLQPSSIVG